MYSELFSLSHVSIFIQKVDNLSGVSFKMRDLKKQKSLKTWNLSGFVHTRHSQFWPMNQIQPIACFSWPVG